MANSLKTILAVIITALVLSAITRAATARVITDTKPNQTESNSLTTRTRVITDNKPNYHTESRTLRSRLNLDDASSNSTSCWESLFKLQACTGEVIQFFYNGETYLGPDCCNAVHIIVHDCWPSMLNSLGFTSQEGDLLRVYCDALAQDQPGPNSPDPSTRVFDNENN